MPNSRIKVKYIPGMAPQVGLHQEFWLNTHTGCLYQREHAPTFLYARTGDLQEQGYKELAPGVWRNGVYEVCDDRHWAKYGLDRTPGPKLDSAVSENSRGAGFKYDDGKPRWTLLMQGCARALEGVANVLTFGAKKYAAHSWKQVENNQERYRDALYRHLNAIERGEELDPESGLPHWDHVACNALFLSQLQKESKDAK